MKEKASSSSSSSSKKIEIKKYKKFIDILLRYIFVWCINGSKEPQQARLNCYLILLTIF